MVHPRSAWSLTAAVVLMASFTVSGCGGNSKPGICSDVDSLKSSITELRDVKLEAGALATLQSDLTNVQTDLSKVKSEAKTQYAAEISSVDQAAASLSASLKTASTTPSVAALAAVATDVSALGASLSALQDAVSSTC
jgi:predicted small secreted protein